MERVEIKREPVPEETEPNRPIYRFVYDPDSGKITRDTITDYESCWGGKRIQFRDGNTVKRVFLKDFGYFAHGRMFTFEGDFTIARITAIKDLNERLKRYEANAERIKGFIKAFESYEEGEND